MSKSEYSANQELTLMIKKEGYARQMFNVSGDQARETLRRHNAKKGKGFAKVVAKLAVFFKG